MADARPDRRDMADALVTGDERQARLHGPVAARGVEVGVADARRREPDHHLARPGLGHRQLLDRQWLAEGVDHRGAHCLSHHLLLSLPVRGRLV